MISKVAHSGSGLERMMGTGIEPRHFSDPESASVWRFMSEHTRKYRQQPSVSVLREKFPDYDFILVSDSLEYIRDRFVENAIRNAGSEAILGLAKALDDPDQVARWPQMFSEQDRRIQQLIPSTAEIGRLSDMEARIAEYRELVRDGNPYGVKMGIPQFDEVTYGIQQHEYVTIQGWLGTGKSTLAQWMLLNAYQQEQKCMYISLEMERQALMRKWDVMLTNVEYRNMKSGALSTDELRRWEKVAARVRDQSARKDIIVVDDIRNCTVDRVYSEIAKHDPDIVAIDYISLMTTSRSQASSTWEKLMYISNNLKQTARTTKTPIIAVAQTNRDSSEGGPELHNIAFSVAINQDSDIVIGMHSNKEDRENRKMQVKLLKNRDGMIRQADLYWDMEHMEFKPWSEHIPFTRPAVVTAP